MSAYKFFKPPESLIESDEVVRLSDGTRVPSWAFIAVPIVRSTSSSGSKVPAELRRVFVDAVTGALTTSRSSPARNELSGGFKTAYDVSGFTRSLNLGDLMAAIQTALPVIESEVDDEIDPGYLDSSGSRVATLDFTLEGYSGEDVFPLGDRNLKDYLVRRRVPQSLADTEYATRSQIVAALGHLAINVVDRIDGDFIIDSGYVPVRYYVPDEEARRGQCVRLEFSGTNEQVYLMAVDMAKTLPYDALFLDYRSTGSPLVTIVLKAGSQRRRIATRYDDRVTVEGKLIRAERNVSISDSVDTTEDDLADTYYDEDDSYQQIVSMLTSNPAMFGGMANVANILKSIGANANPLTNSMGAAVGSGAASSSVRNTLSQSMECPDVKVDPKLFPTASDPALRRVSDVSQLDDSETQNAIPFALRANNPLKVKKVAGVTDLKTRFGYLGEAEGIAVYQDHVGGAAAGLNYLMTQNAGKTMAAATRDMAGTAISKDDRTLAKEVDDVTSLSAAKLFSGMSQHLFGTSDPTGVAQQCATIKPDSMEQTIAYAAAMAKVVAGKPINPLTYDEWASAYQIAKNEPNEHLKKATTGATLPVTEETNTVDTGVQTTSQGKDQRNATDYEKRAKYETWNPVSNYTKYADDVWGSSGSNWIAQGIITYAQKSNKDDNTKMAKAYETQQLSQDKTHPTPTVLLPWKVKTSSA